jgi:hypothetical protein
MMENKQKRYTIKVYYRTGDSFHSEDTTTYVGEWDNLEVAKENLQRIKEHYEYYEYREKSYNIPEIEKKWETKEKNNDIPSYMIVEGQLGGMLTLKLKEDNGDETKMWPPWCGYFERLYEAEIELNPYFDDDMRFSLR